MSVKSYLRSGFLDALLNSLTIRFKCYKMLVNAFILWHCFAMTVWLGGWSGAGIFLHGIVDPYVQYFGVWQSWCVFAPIPKKYNLYLTAEVIFSDGTKEIWEFPRMEKQNVWERPWNERYRKWSSESLYDETIWPDAARFIARTCSTNKHTPLSVSLIRHWSDIPPPETDPAKPIPENNQSATFYIYTVKSEDL